MKDTPNTTCYGFYICSVRSAREYQFLHEGMTNYK